MIRTLGSISAEPNRLVRGFLTPEHRAAADLIGQWMRAAKLQVSEDALGTVRGHWPGAGNKRLLMGSHIDTVIEAGMFDGPLGVIAGILAAEHFSKAGRKLGFGLDVLAFGDEEGSRFSKTLSSSLAVAGAFDVERLDLSDANGMTLRDAVAACGKNADDLPAATYDRDIAAAYVEVHIEQGPVLEHRNQALGVVTAIAGQTYVNVEFLGEAGHAGTVPMLLRRDALTGAAETVLLAERMARDTQGEVVATVGVLRIPNAAGNVVPGNVALIVDIRSGSDEARHKFVGAFKAEIRALAERLVELFRALNGVLDRFEPTAAAVEETFVNKNPASTLKLGVARGVVLLAPAERGIPVHEYSANLIKKSVVGVGHADKTQIQMMVRRLLPGCEIASPDAADALAVAICHAHHAATHQAWSLAGGAAR